MIRKDIQEMVWSGLRNVDLTECVTDKVLLNVITTYDTKYEQQIWDMYVKVVKNEFRSELDNIHFWIPQTMVFNGRYCPEKHILGQVISDISPLNRLPQLCKISLWYKNMGEICPSAYENNRDPENEKDRLEIDRKLDELGFGFIMRTHSKYYFQPDQRDAFETDIMETFKTSKKVRSFKDSVGERFSEKEIESHRIQVEEHRKDTAKYFGLSA
jgi:hypothetical protein